MLAAHLSQSVSPSFVQHLPVPDIGTLIAHHRSGRRLLSSIAAEDTGLTTEELEAFERGDMVPTLEEISRIASRLKMSLGELFSDPNTASSYREHLLELPVEEYMAIGHGWQSVLILRNTHNYRAGDTLRLCSGEMSEFSVTIKAAHMCEMMKSIAFRVPPGFVIVELSE